MRIYITLMKKDYFHESVLCTLTENDFSGSVFGTLGGECGMGNTTSHCFIRFCLEFQKW